MANFCLPQGELNNFLRAIDEGVLDPVNMVTMSSAERNAAFSDIVGPELGKKLNAEYESKLILKDQQRGIETWFRGATGLTKAAERDLISSLGRMKNVLSAESGDMFLRDLAERRLGFTVTFEEAQGLMNLTRMVEEAKQKIVPGTPERGGPEVGTGLIGKDGKEITLNARLNYGLKSHVLEEYVRYLKKEDITIAERVFSKRIIADVAGTMKSMVASLDNSFFGRQGLKVLFSGKKGIAIWSKAFVKSWGDIANELAGKKIRTGIKDKNGKEISLDYSNALIKADVLSRDNALNGKYLAGKFDLGVKFEEAFPSTIPKRVPGLRRIYNASESAFNGAAMRMRADLADFYIKQAEGASIDMLNKENAVPIGRMVNSMTGRGYIGERSGEMVNVLLFSARFLKSNLDVLTAPFQYGRIKVAQSMGVKYTAGEVFARRTAAYNTVKMAIGIALTLYFAEQMFPGSVEKDPRSSDFGKIKIGSTRFDVTGGVGSMAVVAMRLIPTNVDGEWGMWSKTSTGDFRQTTVIGRNAEGKLASTAPEQYGARDSVDVFTDYFLNKASPAAHVPLAIWAGRQFDEDEVTASNLIQQGTLPIIYSTVKDLQKPEAAPMLAGILSDALGIGTNTY